MTPLPSPCILVRIIFGYEMLCITLFVIYFALLCLLYALHYSVCYRDPPVAETPLLANVATTGSQQIPSVTLTYDAFQHIIDGIVENRVAHPSAPSSQSTVGDNMNYAPGFISFEPPFDGSSHDID
ncbi:unnamed protein product, partial [Citrullus colocynthis]